MILNKIRVMIVEDIEDIRNYFKMILSREKDIDVVGTASSGEEACSIAFDVKPDIVLMDVQMETETAGIDAVKFIKSKMPAVKIIILTIHEEDEILFKSYGAGATDFITKTSSIVDILNSIRNVYNNNLQLKPEIASKILNEFSRLQNDKSSMIYIMNIISKLTSTEFEILKASYRGKSYKEIARERFVEEVTIRTQVNKILKKFNREKMKQVINELKELSIFDIYES